MRFQSGSAGGPRPTADAGQAAAEGSKPVSHGLQIKHLAGAALSVSVFLAAGVYWLHRREDGPIVHRTDDSVSQVRLITLSAPDLPAAAAAIPQPTMLPDPTRIPNIEASQPAPERPAAQKQPVPHERLARVATAEMATGPVKSDASLEYQNRLRARIEQFHEYPEAARAGRLQGVVQVIFTLGRSGEVVGIRIKSSSGYALLDQEAIAMIRRARPLPEIPRDLPEQFTVVLPVEFSPP
jgi:periplasmic protein TonB